MEHVATRFIAETLKRAPARLCFRRHKASGDSLTSFVTLRQFYLVVTVVDVCITKVIVPCRNLCFPPPQLLCSLSESGGESVCVISKFLCGALLRRMGLILQPLRKMTASTTWTASGCSANSCWPRDEHEV